MGYTTHFSGGFSIEPALSDEDLEFLINFNESRRMARKVDPKYGIEGEWYVEGDGFRGQVKDDSIIDFNTPPSTQPGLWCQWRPTEDGKTLEWDGGEKAYNMEDWIFYLLEGFFKPKGYILNGFVEAEGEESDDRWSMRVQNNILKMEGASCPFQEAAVVIKGINGAHLEDLPAYLPMFEELKNQPDWMLSSNMKRVLAVLEERIKELE